MKQTVVMFWPAFNDILSENIWSVFRGDVLKQGLCIFKFLSRIKCTSRNWSVINNDARIKHGQTDRQSITANFTFSEACIVTHIS
jgi:hypothetical protein